MARKKKPLRKPTAQHSYHDILDGTAKLFRKDNSGDVWQFQMWIADEKRHLRRSLKTTDLKTAVDRGTDLYLQTYSDIKTGRKIFGITLKELVDAYLNWRLEDVEHGNIKKSRHSTMSSQLKHLVSFKGASTKIASLDRGSCYEYAKWKLKTYPNTKKITIRNEQSTFASVFSYGYRVGYSHIDTLDFRKLVLKETDISRRSTFTLSEYDKLLRTLRSYVSKKQCPDEKERLERLLVRDAILIASNTMLRVGEKRQLRWGDILNIEKIFDDEEQEVSIVTLQVRGEISKTNRTRKVPVRGGQYFERIRERAIYTEPDDFIFSAVGERAMPRKQFWYNHWKVIMEMMGIPDYKTRNLTWYSLRHFGITCRIRAKADLIDIAQLAGTSLSHVEDTYGHWDVSMLKNASMKNFSFGAYGISHKD